MKAPRQAVDVTFTIFRGLPFHQKFLYNTPSGAKVDLTTNRAALTIKELADAPEELFSLSTEYGMITMGDGFFEFNVPADVTVDFQWDQGVGHFVIRESPDEANPLFYVLFQVQESTTRMPA